MSEEMVKLFSQFRSRWDKIRQNNVNIIEQISDFSAKCNFESCMTDKGEMSNVTGERIVEFIVYCHDKAFSRHVCYSCFMNGLSFVNNPTPFIVSVSRQISDSLAKCESGLVAVETGKIAEGAEVWMIREILYFNQRYVGTVCDACFVSECLGLLNLLRNNMEYSGATQYERSCQKHGIPVVPAVAVEMEAAERRLRSRGEL